VHLGGEDSGAATQNAIYCISLLIITHHYAIHYSSLLIITQFVTHRYSSLLKQHYSSLRTITLPQLGQNFIALSEDFMPQNYAYSAITHENQGGRLAPSSKFVRNDE